MTNFGIVDFDIWNNTNDPDFIDINLKSNVRYSWLSFNRIAKGKYKDSVIKPINKYVEVLYPQPELMSISEEEIVLQQKNHAEIAIGYKNGILTTVDKPHIRQYYNSADTYDIPDFCFPKVFKAYMPWIFDENIEVAIEPIEGSPFFIYPTTHQFTKVDTNSLYYSPPFIPFSFKNVGSHMIRDKAYGKILIGSPMFNIIIKSNKEIRRKIEKFYEEK